MAKPKKPARVDVFKIARASATSATTRMAAIAMFIGAMLVVTLAVALPRIDGFAKDLPALMAGGILVAIIALFTWLNLPGKVEVGRDGLILDDRSRKVGRYIPFASIETAERYDEGVLGKKLTGIALELRDGEVVRLPYGEDQFGASEQLAILLQRICSAMEAQRREPSDEDASHLRRQGRDAQGWLAALRRIGAEADAGPRDAPIATERLWRIVESTSHGAAERAGAAVALGPRIDVEGMQRLVRIAEDTASPGLRAAIDGVSRTDERATLAALAELEAAGGEDGALRARGQRS